jgi:hypothetical protein
LLDVREELDEPTSDFDRLEESIGRCEGVLSQIEAVIAERQS